MELKLWWTGTTWVDATLLIVPYGIETPNNSDKLFLILLLIVPYGIETVS